MSTNLLKYKIGFILYLLPKEPHNIKQMMMRLLGHKHLVAASGTSTG